MRKDESKPSRGRPVNETAREKRVNQILDGARECFIARGFHASSISEIAAAAGVSVANIYQYFPGKDALIIALIELDLARHQSLISRFWSSDFTREAIEGLVAEIFLTSSGHAVAALRAEIVSEGARNPAVAALLRDSESGLIDSVRGKIMEAQGRGVVSRDLDPDVVTDRLALAFEGLMRLYLFSPANGKDLVDRYYRQFADALQLGS